MKENKTKPPRSPRILRIFDHDIDKRTFKSLTKQKVLACDTETSGLDFRKDKLLLTQICTVEGRVYMIRHPDHKSSYLSQLMTDNLKTWIFHNASFDIRFLKMGIGFFPKGNIECTKTLMKIIHPNLMSGLAAALRKRRNIILRKGIKHEWDVPKLSKEQIKYASEDVLELHGLYKQIKEDSNWRELIIYKNAMEGIRITANIEVEGYTDLFGYEQNDYETTLKQQNWWRFRPFAKTLVNEWWKLQ